MMRRRELVTLHRLIRRLGTVFRPTLVRIFRVFQHGINGNFLFATTRNVGIVFTRQRFLSMFEAVQTRNSFQISIGVAPFNVRVKCQIGTTRVVGTGILQLQLFIFPRVPFPSNLDSMTLVIRRLQRDNWPLRATQLPMR